MSEETVTQVNKKEIEQAEADYQKFIAAFKINECSLCHKSLKTFSVKSPCLHWLLRPKGFKKKHFPSLFTTFPYFRISSYIRWVASLAGPMKNINDFKVEHPGEKIIDFTARHKHITWSLSCSQSDYEGHQSTTHGKIPHYHIQVKLNGKIFIKYGDFHIPFHEDDLYDLDLFINHGDVVKHSYGRGSGLQFIFDDEDRVEALIHHLVPTSEEDQATIHLSTMVDAGEGGLISGDLVADAIEEAKTSNLTIAAVLREKLKDTGAKVTTVVSPGKGVPEPQQRSGGRAGKKQRDP